MTRARREPVNGSGRLAVGSLATAGGTALPYSDPMARVFALDAESSSTARWVGYLLGAIALMMGLTVAVRIVGLLIAMTNVAPAAAAVAQEIDVVHDEAPPPPQPTAEPEKPEPAPPPRAAPHEPPPPPPAPAQAAKVLTQEPDPNEPVDLTGNTFVSGNADVPIGGATSVNGTSKTQRAAAAATGVAGGTAAPSATGAVAGPDLSRKPSVGDADWSNCPFPPEADTAQIDDTYVTVSVEVRPDGSPARVHVVKEPGYGFGREAVKYAMGKHFVPALDREGHPIAGTATVRLHFTR